MTVTEAANLRFQVEKPVIRTQMRKYFQRWKKQRLEDRQTGKLLAALVLCQ